MKIVFSSSNHLTYFRLASRGQLLWLRLVEGVNSSGRLPVGGGGCRCEADASPLLYSIRPSCVCPAVTHP